MLVSQRIARDPAWLRTAHVTKNSKQAVFDLRMKIVRAVKMIVPQELLDTDRPLADLDKQIFGHTPPTKDESQRRLNLYGKFSRPPYPLLFVENHTGGVLIEEQDDGSFDIHVVLDTGRCLFFCTNIRLSEEELNADTKWRVPVEEVVAALGNRYDEYLKMKEMSDITTVIGVVEMFLYVNTKNVVKHHYHPTKRENQAVPKPLLPHYSYRVLDVFKDRKQYISLEQITEDLCNPNKPPQARRAGLVMGHFKKRATGLFWWNTYIRNARNETTHGAIEKDYKVHLDA